MERFEPGVFTHRVLESVRVLRLDIMVVFSKRVSEMIKVGAVRDQRYCVGGDDKFLKRSRDLCNGEKSKLKTIRYFLVTKLSVSSWSSLQ